MFDLIIRGGEICDGTGDARFRADLAIKDDKIAAIGLLGDEHDAEYVDVSGFVVAPGFIDLHTHSDFTLIADGRAESQVHQGVTTEVIGQCGVSCAPVCDHHAISSVAPWHIEQVEHAPWQSFSGYLDVLGGAGLGVNVAALVGHGTVHRAVLGEALSAGDADDIAEMARIVDAALAEGAAGISSGLEYWPGILASPSHLVPLCEVAARRGALYATHVRNRDTHYDLGYSEAIATARQSGARLQISHIQPKFGAPDYAMEHTLELIDASRRRGVDIAFDVIPHDWAHTIMAAILPKWAQAGGIDAVLGRLRDPETRLRIKENPEPMWLIVKARRWRDIVLLNAAGHQELVGANFEEIGRIRGVDPYDAVLDILLEEGENLMSVFWSSKSFRDEDIDLCLRQPECAVISDTVALATDGVLHDQIGSLSGYGWAARFLQVYVRDRAVLSLEDGIRKLTSLPAERLGVDDRGTLRVGSKADVCVFDAESIASHCDAKEPRRYATGVIHVLVNGKFSMRDGNRTGVNAGTVLRDIAS